MCKDSTDIMACLIDPETEAGRQLEAKDAERLLVARQLSRQDSYNCHRLSRVADSTNSIMSATTTMSVYVSLNPCMSDLRACLFCLVVFFFFFFAIQKSTKVY